MATMATVTLEDFETLPPCMTALESQTDGQPLRLAATSCGEPVTVATPPLPPEASAQAAKVLPETFSVAALRASSHCTMPVGGATGAGGGLGLGGGGLGGGGLGGGGLRQCGCVNVSLGQLDALEASRQSPHSQGAAG